MEIINVSVIKEIEKIHSFTTDLWPAQRHLNTKRGASVEKWITDQGFL